MMETYKERENQRGGNEEKIEECEEQREKRAKTGTLKEQKDYGKKYGDREEKKIMMTTKKRAREELRN